MPARGEPAVLRTLIPEEKIGIVLTLIAIVLGLSWAFLYQRFWVLSFLPSLLFFIVFIGFAVGKSIDAIKEPEVPAGLRWRKALAIPLMVGGFWTLDALTGLTSRASAYAFLWTHGDELAAAERLAGPGRPVALPYIQDVPDSGVAIIRSDVEPTRLSDRQQRWLVSEPINKCRRLQQRDWQCWYD
jgi:hypothetical protein